MRGLNTKISLFIGKMSCPLAIKGIGKKKVVGNLLITSRVPDKVVENSDMW